METKNFQVGQVWKARNGELRRIDMIGDANDSYPIYSTDLNGGYFKSHTDNGEYFQYGIENQYDLVALLTNADVTKVHPELPSPIQQPEGSLVAPAQYGVMDTSRTEFIDTITREMFAFTMFDDDEAAKRVRAAVAVRDELVCG
jgi:hypothetical protein